MENEKRLLYRAISNHAYLLSDESRNLVKKSSEKQLTHDDLLDFDRLVKTLNILLKCSCWIKNIDYDNTVIYPFDSKENPTSDN